MTNIFKLPQMSITMLEGTISKWLKKEGDLVQKNEPLVEIEMDKATSELTSPQTGYLKKILVNEGDTLPIGEGLCVFGEKDDVFDGGTVEAPATPATSATPAVSSQNPSSEPVRSEPGERRRISPLAARMAKDLGVVVDSIEGTGPGGTIVKKDIERAKVEQGTKAASTGLSTGGLPEVLAVIPFKGIRKKTAEQMMRSRQSTATLTTFAEADVGGIKKMREYVPVSYTAYIVKAVAEALNEFPQLNSSLVGDEIHQYAQANINVAVAGDGRLVTPVLRNAAGKNLLQIADDIKDLSNRGRSGTLSLEDFSGGTFTVTNSGVFGSLFFTPIINFPQCAILGVGKMMDTPVVRNGEIVIAPMMNLCLSYDHRLVDGEPAVRFLQRVKYFIENPKEILIRAEGGKCTS